MSTRLHIESPLIVSDPLSKALGVPVYLKLDNLQPSGAKYQMPVTVVVPESAVQRIIERIQTYGATVLVHGAAWDEAHAYAMSLLDEESLYVPPFDHPDIWEGNQTIVQELHRQLPQEPSLIVCSVGGGGMFNGIWQGLLEVGWKSSSMLAVETKGADSLNEAVRQNEHVSLEAITSIAKTLGAKKVAKQTFEYARDHQERVKRSVVLDEEVVQCIHYMLRDHQFLLEPACAAALTPLYFADKDLKLDLSQGVVVQVCGGSIVTTALLDEWTALFAKQD